MRKEIHNLGNVGVIKDLAPWQLPENGFTTSHNIRFADGQAGTFAGYSSFATPSVVPYFVTNISSATKSYWVYAGLDDVYTYDGTSHIKLTRGGGVPVVYTGTSSDRWNSDSINGYLILNNNVDVPQSWLPADANDCVNLTGWDANHTALIVRAYKDFLIALNVTKSGTNYPHLVKWSDAADSNSLPSSWDETSTTGEAGENSISNTDGKLLDGVKLRDSFILYKEDSVFGMQYIGGSFIFRFYRISGLIGALAQQCVVDLGDRHFVLGNGDCYIHDGQNSKSVIDKKNRDLLFSVIDGDNYVYCFVRLHKKLNEVWVCYPESGETYPNKAFIWNYADETWTQRDLNSNTVSMDFGIVDSSGYTWNTLPFTWNQWNVPWLARQYTPMNDSLVSVTTDTEMFKHEDGNQDNGTNVTVTLEKTNLELGQGSHMVKAIHPYAEGQSFNVYVGQQATKNSGVTWEGPFSFDPSSDRRVNCRVTGRYHAIRFESISDVSWTVSGYGIEYESSGLR